jgi:thermitase
LVAATVLMLSTVVAANAQQPVDSAAGQAEAYPFVTIASAAGGSPIRKLKTTKTSKGLAVADRLIVAFKADLTDSDRAQIHQHAASLGAGAARSVLALHDGFYLVDVAGASLEAAAAAYRAADPRVVAAGPDFIGTAATTTDDPLASRQTHLTRIQANAAWERARGTGIKIAIVDSGIDDTHPDLAGKVDAKVTMLGEGTSLLDDSGHGTGMAGIAAAATNNAVGVAGVAYDARLLSVKASSHGEFPASAAANGIRWAADNGADIINMSFVVSVLDCASSDSAIAMLREAVNYAWGRNAVLVASAGKEDSTLKHTPASCPHVISVAATDDNDVRAPFTTHGPWVTVAAPGVRVLTTRANVLTHSCASLPGVDARYGLCTGSSPAAAVVSGIAALVRATCGAWNQIVVDRITGGADRIAGTGSDWQFGRVNAWNAVCIPRPSMTQTSSTPSSLTYSWADRSLESFFEFWHRPVSGAWTAVTLPANTTQYTINGLQMGGWYETTMRACDGRGCSEYSPSLVKRVNYFQLNVSRVGGGSVKSRPAGIDCRPRSTRCQAVFQTGTTIHLDAIGGLDPNTGRNWDFDHWEGACSSAGWSQTCTLQVSDPQPTLAIAVFTFAGTN